MCAIAGIIGKEATKESLLRMLRSMEHRGDSGCFGEITVVPGFALGANRLAIVDPSHGRQPFHSEDDHVICIQNGEIYNCGILRLEMGAEKFRTTCDTEVLLQAWISWNSDMLKHVEGMYAAAFADMRTGAWMIARDPLGIKPLYWARSRSNIYFSSEIKALTELSLHADIYELPPGSVMSNEGVATVIRLPDLLPLEIEDDEAIRFIRKELTRVVASHLPPSGHPVASLLSGGVDSSTILYLMRQLHDGPIEAFTLASDEGPSSDLEAASSLCDELRIPLRVVSPSTKSLTTFYLQQGVAMTETFESALVRNAVAYHFLCLAVRQAGFKFCLSGEGADELFGGYDYFKQLPPRHVDEWITRSIRSIHQTYLLMADRASMYASVEVRVPYMDFRFVGAAATVGPSARLRGPTDKWVLRNLFQAELPALNRLRSKVGMNAGAGFGPNDPGQGIYSRAVSQFYADSGTYEADLEVAATYAQSYCLDLDNREEIFNFARYHERGFCRFVGGRQRQQLNTVKLSVASPLSTLAQTIPVEQLR